jgi:peptide/nickel transport system permease protein
MLVQETNKSTRTPAAILRSDPVRLIRRRLLMLVLEMLVISFIVFSLLDLAPGNTAEILLNGQPASAATIHAIDVRYHLNDPFIEQYLLWLKGAVHLDFGNSIQSGQSVMTVIMNRLPVTLFLGIYAFLIALVGGLVLGVLAALRRGRPSDQALITFSMIGASAPAFVSGLLLLYLFSVRIDLFPSYGVGSGFASELAHMTLPAVALAFAAMAVIMRLTRSSMVNSMSQDYITFARGRGVGRLRIVVRYGLRNALGPVITAMGMVLAFVLTGAVIVEQVFGLPGVGSMFLEAVETKDIPLVQGFTILACLIVVVINLFVDVAYLLMDPQIRATGGIE